MILIIPAIQIKDGKCLYKVKTLDGTECSDDPVDMAKLWRTENAKSLHVTDINGKIIFSIQKQFIKGDNIILPSPQLLIRKK